MSTQLRAGRGGLSACGRVRPAVLGYCTLTNAGLWETGAQFLGRGGHEPRVQRTSRCLLRSEPHPEGPHPQGPSLAPELPSISSLLAHRLGAAGPGAPPTSPRPSFSGQTRWVLLFTLQGYIKSATITDLPWSIEKERHPQCLTAASLQLLFSAAAEYTPPGLAQGPAVHTASCAQPTG